MVKVRLFKLITDSCVCYKVNSRGLYMILSGVTVSRACFVVCVCLRATVDSVASLPAHTSGQLCHYHPEQTMTTSHTNRDTLIHTQARN